MTVTRRRAVVVGGGIAGLSAAFDLHQAGWEVDIYEAGDRWGGKIWSSPVGDRLVDAGPDTFLARAEAGRQLCADLGLTDELTSPVSAVAAYIARGESLYELPAGSMLGVPTDLDALASSGLVSADGVERAQHDLDAPPTPIDGDLSVGELCRSRLGDEVTDLLIDPLLGGINASDIDRLSLKAGAPLLAAATERSPSLIQGLASLRPTTGATLGSAAPSEPVFFGLPGGIARIINRLVEVLTTGPSPARLHLSNPVEALGELLDRADAVVVATPAPITARLVRPLSPSAADTLATIEYASVAQVVVELPLSGVERDLDASGILFPRVGGTVLTACTWLSTKWAHYRRPGTVLLRLSSGRFGDERPAAMTDDELARNLLGELSQVVRITAPPTAVRVTRWHSAFPQYVPHHRARIDALGVLAVDAPSVRLAGAAYDGIGIPACIDSGRRAAQAFIKELG